MATAVSLRPLLACTLDDVQILRLPAIGSAKLDGIRCTIDDGTAISRNGKAIRNRFIQGILGQPCYNGLDGELIVGPPSGSDVFNRTTSGVMSAEGEPDFTYWIFDNHLIPFTPYALRLKSLNDYPRHDRIAKLSSVVIHTLDELASFERKVLGEGFEGVMLRRVDGPYKQGRSTLNEQILLRLKRFRDGEAIITGLEEGKINDNEAITNSMGYIERSTHQANMRKAGRVGTILATDLSNGQALRISPGRMTAEQRIRYWGMPNTILMRHCRYKCFDYGSIDAPRFATFQAFLDGYL
jgi:DNA ligase-1